MKAFLVAIAVIVLSPLIIVALMIGALFFTGVMYEQERF
jgi:hypothetical protein